MKKRSFRWRWIPIVLLLLTMAASVGDVIYTAQKKQVVAGLVSITTEPKDAAKLEELNAKIKEYNIDMIDGAIEFMTLGIVAGFYVVLLRDFNQMRRMLDDYRQKPPDEVTVAKESLSQKGGILR